MKAYKPVYGGKENSLRFEVGRTYIFDGELNTKQDGFQFYREAVYILDNCGFSDNFALLEIEVAGDCKDYSRGISTTNKLTVVRVVPEEEYGVILSAIVKNGKLVYRRTGLGDDEFWEYDERGNLIKWERPNGDVYKYKYNDQNLLIMTEYNETIVTYFRYTSNGNLISERKSFTDNESLDEFVLHVYNSNGHKIKTIYSDRTWVEMDCDPYGNVIHTITESNVEEWFDYDGDGNEVAYRNSYKEMRWSKYDERGNLVQVIDYSGFKEIRIHDDDDNLIGVENTEGTKWGIIIK